MTLPIDDPLTPEQRYALSLVLLERKIQDAKWGNPGHDDGHDDLGWREIFERYAYRLGVAMAQMPSPEFDLGREAVIDKALRQMAAVTLACMEVRARRKEL